MAKPRKRKTSVRRRRPAAKPAPAASVPVAEVIADEPPGVEAVSEAPAPVGETFAPEDRVSLGSVECRRKRLPTDVVLGLLSPDGLRRIEAEKQTSSFESLRQRMLASDGHATPIFFEDGPHPSILHGYAELAAAQVCGVPEISVLFIPAGGASEAQAFIVEMVRKQVKKQETSDDDDLIWRVNALDQ